MTIADDTVSQTFEGDGSTTTFAIPFTFYATSEIRVTLIGEDGTETELTEGAEEDYTLTGANPPTDPLPFNVEMNTAPATGEHLRVKRVTARLQPVDLSNTAAWEANSVETQWDRTVNMIQEVDREVDRALKIAEGIADTVDIELPSPVAGKHLAWNSTATALENTDRSGWSTGSGAPSVAIEDAVMYLDTATGDVYAWNGSAWSLSTNITGPQGEQGVQGEQGPQGEPGEPGEAGAAGDTGAQGTSSRVGSGAPASGLGNTGDVYVDQDTGDLYEKTDATTWTLVGNLTGPQGEQGVQGVQGEQGVQGDPGEGVAVGGTAGQLLSKVDGTDYNTEWVDPPSSLPAGGTTGQVLTKASNTDGDATWQDATGGGGGSGDLSVVSKSAAYTITTSDDLVLASASGAAFTLTLPTAVGISGKQFIIKKTDTTLNAVTIDGDGSETIDGETSTTLNTEGETLKLVSDGTNWQILERHIPQIYNGFSGTIAGTVSGSLTIGTGGSAEATFKYARVGSEIIATYMVRMGTSGTADATGTYLFPLPSGIALDVPAWSAIGVGTITTTSTGAPVARLVAKRYSTGFVLDRSDSANLAGGSGLMVNTNILSVQIRAKVTDWNG